MLYFSSYRQRRVLSRKCYSCHGSCNSGKASRNVTWNLIQLAQWRCLKIILKLGNHIYLENFVIVLIKLENLKSIPWKAFLFNTDLKRKVNIKDEIFPCKWVNKPKIEPEVQGFLIKHSKTVTAYVVPWVHLGYFDACKLRQSRLLI